MVMNSVQTLDYVKQFQNDLLFFLPSFHLQVVVVLQQVFQLIQKVLSKWLNDAQVVEVMLLSGQLLNNTYGPTQAILPSSCSN